MKDIFLSPHGNMLSNWEKAFPKAWATISTRTMAADVSTVFWVHANANDGKWLKNTMAQIKQKFQDSKVIVLANTPNQADALAAITQGVSGYCHAYSDAKMLKEVKTVVMHGGVWLGNDLLQTLIRATKPLVHNASSTVESALKLLTEREKEAALEAAKGLSNKEIARLLDITERTVKAHISKVFEKLGVKDRLQLALMLNDNPKPAAKSKKNVKSFKSKSKASHTKKSKKKLEYAA